MPSASSNSQINSTSGTAINNILLGDLLPRSTNQNMRSNTLLNTNPINSIEMAKVAIKTSIKHNEYQSLPCGDGMLSSCTLALRGRNDKTESTNASIVPVIVNR